MATPKKILVLGGTRFFGKRLVERLLHSGHAVTIATRGRTSDPFGDRVDRRIVDRADSRSLRGLRGSRSWDAVVDQICFSPDEAASAAEIFVGHVGRWIHTSTSSIYRTYGIRDEGMFDPYAYPLRKGAQTDFDYGEGKRLAEAALFQLAPFSVASMRIPVVLGPEDYKGRLAFHIARVREGRATVVPDPTAEASFIHAEEAARFLEWLVDGTATGPLNACSNGTISIGTVIREIESVVGRKAVIVPGGAPEDFSPLIDVQTRTLDTRRARDAGFRFDELSAWLPALIDELGRKILLKADR